MFLKTVFIFCLIVFSGCASETNPVLIDCDNGYFVRPPLACPSL